MSADRLEQIGREITARVEKLDKLDEITEILREELSYKSRSKTLSFRMMCWKC